MSTPLIATLVSVSAFVLLTALFIHERARGTRYLRRFRSYVDGRLDASARGIGDTLPRVNSDFVRQSFHYVAHKILAAVLFILRRFEYAVERIARFNRIKARTATNGNGNTSKETSHLAEITRHKEQAQLSEREKKQRRQKALEGD